jgi:hypothetical protein
MTRDEAVKKIAAFGHHPGRCGQEQLVVFNANRDARALARGRQEPCMKYRMATSKIRRIAATVLPKCEH